MPKQDTVRLKDREEYGLLFSVVEELLQKNSNPLNIPEKEVFFLDDKRNLENLKRILYGFDEDELKKFIIQRDPLYTMFPANSSRIKDKSLRKAVQDYRVESLVRFSSAKTKSTIRDEVLSIIRREQKYHQKNSDAFMALKRKINELATKRNGMPREKYAKIRSYIESPDLSTIKLNWYITTRGKRAVADNLASQSEAKRSAIGKVGVGLISEQYLAARSLGTPKSILIEMENVLNKWNKDIVKSGPIYDFMQVYIRRLFVSSGDRITQNVAKSMFTKDGEKYSLTTPYLAAMIYFVREAIVFVPMQILITISQLFVLVGASLTAIVSGLASLITLGRNEDIVNVFKTSATFAFAAPYFGIVKIFTDIASATVMPFLRIYRFNSNRVMDVAYPTRLDMRSAPKHLGDSASVRQAHAHVKKFVIRNYLLMRRDPIINFYMSKEFQSNNFGYASSMIRKPKPKLPPQILESLRKYVTSVERHDLSKLDVMRTQGGVLLGEKDQLKQLLGDLKTQEGPDTKWTKQLKHIFAEIGLMNDGATAAPPPPVIFTSSEIQRASTDSDSSKNEITAKTGVGQWHQNNVVLAIKEKQAEMPKYKLHDATSAIGRLLETTKKYSIKDANKKVVGEMNINKSGEISLIIHPDANSKTQIIKAFALFVNQLPSPIHDRSINVTGANDDQKEKVRNMMLNRFENSALEGVKITFSDDLTPKGKPSSHTPTLT